MKTNHTTRGHLIPLLLLLLTSASPVPAQVAPPAQPPPAAQEEVQTVVIDGRARAQVRLAFPSADYDASLSSTDLHAAREIEQALRSDLEDTEVFNTQGPTELSVLTLTGNRDYDFEQYRSLGNEVVLLASIRRENDKLVLEGRVYDLPSRQSITGKRYRGLPAQARRIAHSLADEMHYQFTGRSGIALTTIAFHSDRDGFKELYLMDYDGRGQRPISAHKSDSGFCDWSPTGDAVAYMSYWAGTPGIYYVDLASGRKVPVYNGGTLNLSPSFAPDGKRIAFAHSSESNVDIYICPRDGCSQPQRLTSSRAIDTNPVWSPSGRQLAFTSDRSGRPNIYVMDADGGNVRRISFEGEYNDGATWRPDGTQIAYASRRGNRFRIVVTGLVDLATRILASGADSYEEPSYSPDGRRLAFTMKRGKESQIFVMDADGSDWRQLTHEDNNMSPDWSGFPPK